MQAKIESLSAIVAQTFAKNDEEREQLNERANVVLTKIVEKGISALEPAEFYRAWVWGAIPSREQFEKVAFDTPENRLKYVGKKILNGESDESKQARKEAKEEARREAAMQKAARAEERAKNIALRRAQKEAAKKKFEPVMSVEDFQKATKEERAIAFARSNGTYAEIGKFYGVSNGFVNKYLKLGRQLLEEQTEELADGGLFDKEDLQ